MFEIFFEKIYNKDLIAEPYFLGFPLKKGELTDVNCISIQDENNNPQPVQAKATAYWDDGSVKWAFIRSVADLPANKAVKYYCHTDKKGCTTQNPISIDGLSYNTGALNVVLSTQNNRLFEKLTYNNTEFDCNFISYPKLKLNNGICDFKVDRYETEVGDLCTIVNGYGKHSINGLHIADFQITLTFYAGKPWFEIGYCIINTTDTNLEISGLTFEVQDNSPENSRYLTGISNYSTKYDTGKDEPVYTEIDANYLKYESNEHNAEVFYGTFFGDYSNSTYGICATIFQAQQNFPKAIEANKNGLKIMLVPEEKCITLKSGMARQQKILLHFHPADEDIQQINHRSTVYQMPCRPQISPQVFKTADIFENIFTEKTINAYETYIICKADEHGRCYGMLNWGDVPDGGYTAQGRGNGRLVWTNNEYDFPHACMLMYARTGIRRYMDYVLVAARHWMDVDICHYSNDPLIMDGQYEHCAGHIDDQKVACSHQWVEGLLDYYHLTGDKDAFNAAIGIGRNVLRQLEQPVFQKSGQANARETGWALRTLVALYKETNDKKWLEKCDWIVGHFVQWEQEFGLWLAPYTDNSSIRVVFMIAIAVCSLMRYYRINPQPEIKDMILRAIDDLVENARLDNGLFYYKELPSLKRLGNNPIILEALTYAYELSGNVDYLKAGLPTFESTLGGKPSLIGGMGKQIIEDTLVCGNVGTKSFAQVMLPFTSFYAAAAKEGLL